MDLRTSETSPSRMDIVQVSSKDLVNDESSSEVGIDSDNSSELADETPEGDGSSNASSMSNTSLLQSDHDKICTKRKGHFAYMKTLHFWLVLGLGQVLSLGSTGTNTLSTLLADKGVSIPAFQIVGNYVVLNIAYTGFTLYRYGLKKYGKFLVKDGWRYAILSFLDVEGNYFVVLAYRYTTILSVQLINLWAIVVVVVVSLVFLNVRFRAAQYTGILICVGGMGILIGSDHITGANSYGGNEQVRGDLLALLGATCYGLSNVFEEFLVSKRPLYEVIGQLGFWGMIFSGLQASIFDRAQWRQTKWTPAVEGYYIGFTLILSIFYTLVPILLRLASAAFFNISLLTANFWGVLIGIQVFGYSVHWMYPIAFVLIVLGLVVYFMTDRVTGERKKPWLGENQERRTSGIATFRPLKARWMFLRRSTPPQIQTQGD